MKVRESNMRALIFNNKIIFPVYRAHKWWIDIQCTIVFRLQGSWHKMFLLLLVSRIFFLKEIPLSSHLGENNEKNGHTVFQIKCLTNPKKEKASYPNLYQISDTILPCVTG